MLLRKKFLVLNENISLKRKMLNLAGDQFYAKSINPRINMVTMELIRNIKSRI